MVGGGKIACEGGGGGVSRHWDSCTGGRGALEVDLVM